MKANIHPGYPTTKVHCACGNSWETRSTAGELHLDICSACHPFFTGKQKLLDTQGRIERFKKKYEGGEKARAEKKAEDAAAKAAQQPVKMEARPKALEAEKPPRPPKGEKKPKAEKAKAAGEKQPDKE